MSDMTQDTTPQDGPSAQYVGRAAGTGHDGTTHGIRGGEPHYDRPGANVSECGITLSGIDSMHSGTPLPITCGSCCRVIAARERKAAATA